MAKILLADDSTHAQRMGTKILSAEGHEVTTASNGQAAIKMMDEFAPDLIVADIFMPGKNGYELCQWIKSNPKWNHLPVLLTIGAMEPYDPAEGRKAHADGLVTKPLESSDLLETVQKLLANVKKPVPPPPVPAEEPVEETAPFEEEETPIAPAPEELKLPDDFAQQPVALFNDLLGSPAPAEIEKDPFSESAPLEFPKAEEILPTPETGQTFSAANFVEQEITPEKEQQPLAQDFLLDASAAKTEETVTLEAPPAEEPQTAISALLEPQAEEKMVWVAESVPVTAQDEKLFAHTSDWESLTKLTEEESQDQPATAVKMESEPLQVSMQTPSLGPPAGSPQPEEETLSSEPGMTVPSSSLVVSNLPETSEPTVAPIDRLTIEQLVRESVEEMMPQIVDRIVQAIGIPLPPRTNDH
ncbi:MAG: response regulator [Acidobacteria bacterium]|nr:response regulator [Acidobacteriota bacterium]